MKKILSLTVAFTLIAAASFAQQASSGDNIRRHSARQEYKKGEANKFDKSDSRKDAAKFKAGKHRSWKDGKITHKERKKLHKMKKHNRHHGYAAKHNHHRRHK